MVCENFAKIQGHTYSPINQRITKETSFPFFISDFKRARFEPYRNTAEPKPQVGWGLAEIWIEPTRRAVKA
jgi:hypothetical protein